MGTDDFYIASKAETEEQIATAAELIARVEAFLHEQKGI